MAKEFQVRLGKDFYLGGNDIKLNQGDALQVVNFGGSKKSPILGWKYFKFILKNKITNIYSREERIIFFIYLYNFFVRTKLSYTFEAHFVPPKGNFIFYFMMNRVDGIVALTRHMKKDLENNGIKTKILIAPDGVDIERFSTNSDRLELRKRLNIPLNKHIIVYTGHLYSWKGIHTLALASGFLGENCLIIFIGGTEEDLKSFREKYGQNKNILITGHKNHSEIPDWLAIADVLVLPNSAKEDISKFHTSPLKLFEYMASSRSIVASDLPSIREVLNENNSVLVEPDNPEKLAEGIRKAIEDKELAGRITKKAREDVLNYSWTKRTARVLDFVTH